MDKAAAASFGRLAMAVIQFERWRHQAMRTNDHLLGVSAALAQLDMPADSGALDDLLQALAKNDLPALLPAQLCARAA